MKRVLAIGLFLLFHFTVNASIKTAFNDKFFNAKNNVYSTGSQTAMSMPYCVGLVDEGNKKSRYKEPG